MSLFLPSTLTICLALTIRKRLKKQLYQVQKKMLLVLAFWQGVQLHQVTQAWLLQINTTVWLYESKWQSAAVCHQNALRYIKADSTLLGIPSLYHSLSFGTGNVFLPSDSIQTGFAPRKSYLLLPDSPVLLFQALQFSKLCVTQLCKGTLMWQQLGQLFFLHDFQQSLLNCFPNQHFQDRLNFNVKVKQLRMGVRETEINVSWSQLLLTSIGKEKRRMNKALVPKPGWRSAGGGSVSAKAERIMSAAGG